MTDPAITPAEIVRPPVDEIITVELRLNPRCFANLVTGARAEIGADALESLATGDRNAALAAALSSLLDLMAVGQAGAAGNAVAISLELARRMLHNRAELRASL